MNEEKNPENVEETKKLNESENITDNSQGNNKVEEKTSEEVKKEPEVQEKQVETKLKKPLGKRILTFIVGFIIYLVIVAVISAIYFLWEKSNKQEETQAQEEIAWGDTYIKILEDEENFKNLEDVQIALCDISQDNTPELIVYGIKDNDKNSANIYNINSKGEVDTVKFELSEEFNTEYLYNQETDEYEWKIVTENEEIYDISLDESDYQVEESKDSYDDFEVVETTSKTPYEVGTDNPKEVFENAENVYKPSEDLKTKYNSDEEDKKPNSSSSNAEEAIKAYKQALITNDFGKEFNMYTNLMDDSEGYTDFTGEYAFLADLDGDEIPELFYVGGFKDQPYGDGTIQMTYKNGELDMSFNGEVYILGIFKNLQGDGYFAQVSTSPQWDSKGYHIIDLTDNTEFIVELDTFSLDDPNNYYRFDFTDVGNLQNYYNEVNNEAYSDKYQKINEIQYNDYCAKYVGENSYPAGSAYIDESIGMGEIVTVEINSGLLSESEVNEKFDEIVKNYEDLCDTLSK